MKKRDKVLKHIPTLKKGHKQAVTHAGSSSWAPPSFLEQEISMTEINPNVVEATRLQESIRTQTIQLRRLQDTQQQNDILNSEDSDEDYEDESVMSEDSGAMKVAPQEDKTARLLRQLIDSQAAMEAKINERIDTRLMATLHSYFGGSNQTLPGSTSAEGSTAGGHHSTLPSSHE